MLKNQGAHNLNLGKVFALAGFLELFMLRYIGVTSTSRYILISCVVSHKPINHLHEYPDTMEHKTVSKGNVKITSARTWTRFYLTL
jgi:hypothetical protein